MTKTRHLKTLIVLFFVFIFVKILFAVFLSGPTTFPDESCFALKARDLLENFSFRPCEELSKLDSGGEFPFYIFFISGVLHFFHGKVGFIALMVFQSIVSASMIFPLFSIVKKFISNNKTGIILSSVLLFVPQIFVYEKTMMSEILFIYLGILFLHFYLNSFEKNMRKNKIFAYLFAILCLFTRPFGFIVILSATINDYIVHREKKYLVMLVFMFFSSIFFLSVFSPKGLTNLLEKFLSLFSVQNLSFLLISFVNQLNSFLIATFFIPVFIFFILFLYNKNKIFLRIKYFLLSLFLLNFLISMQHVFGYYLEKSELSLLTRYIVLSNYYLIIFSLIFLSKFKNITLKKRDLLIFFTLILSFSFLGEVAKRVQNIDISAFYSMIRGVGESKTFFMVDFKYPLLLFFVFLFYLFYLKKYILLRNILISVLILVSIFSIRILSMSSVKSSLVDFVLDRPDQPITFVVSPKNRNILHVWKFLAYSNFDYEIVTNFSEEKFLHNIDSFKGDLIITFFDIPGLTPMGESVRDGVTYKVYLKE